MIAPLSVPPAADTMQQNHPFQQRYSNALVPQQHGLLPTPQYTQAQQNVVQYVPVQPAPQIGMPAPLYATQNYNNPYSTQHTHSNKRNTPLPHNWDGSCDVCRRTDGIQQYFTKSNTNGNAGKPFVTCTICDRWLGFIPITGSTSTNTVPQPPPSQQPLPQPQPPQQHSTQPILHPVYVPNTQQTSHPSMSRAQYNTQTHSDIIVAPVAPNNHFSHSPPNDLSVSSVYVERLPAYQRERHYEEYERPRVRDSRDYNHSPYRTQNTQAFRRSPPRSAPYIRSRSPTNGYAQAPYDRRSPHRYERYPHSGTYHDTHYYEDDPLKGTTAANRAANKVPQNYTEQHNKHTNNQNNHNQTNNKHNHTNHNQNKHHSPTGRHKSADSKTSDNVSRRDNNKATNNTITYTKHPDKNKQDSQTDQTNTTQNTNKPSTQDTNHNEKTKKENTTDTIHKEQTTTITYPARLSNTKIYNIDIKTDPEDSDYSLPNVSLEYPTPNNSNNSINTSTQTDNNTTPPSFISLHSDNSTTDDNTESRGIRKRGVRAGRKVQERRALAIRAQQQQTNIRITPLEQQSGSSTDSPHKKQTQQTTTNNIPSVIGSGVDPAVEPPAKATELKDRAPAPELHNAAEQREVNRDTAQQMAEVQARLEVLFTNAEPQHSIIYIPPTNIHRTIIAPKAMLTMQYTIAQLFNHIQSLEVYLATVIGADLDMVAKYSQSTLTDALNIKSNNLISFIYNLLLSPSHLDKFNEVLLQKIAIEPTQTPSTTPIGAPTAQSAVSAPTNNFSIASSSAGLPMAVPSTPINNAAVRTSTSAASVRRHPATNAVTFEPDNMANVRLQVHTTARAQATTTTPQNTPTNTAPISQPPSMPLSAQTSGLPDLPMADAEDFFGLEKYMSPVCIHEQNYYSHLPPKYRKIIPYTMPFAQKIKKLFFKIPLNDWIEAAFAEECHTHPTTTSQSPPTNSTNKSQTPKIHNTTLTNERLQANYNTPNNTNLQDPQTTNGNTNSDSSIISIHTNTSVDTNNTKQSTPNTNSSNSTISNISPIPKKSWADMVEEDEDMEGETTIEMSNKHESSSEISLEIVQSPTPNNANTTNTNSNKSNNLIVNSVSSATMAAPSEKPPSEYKKWAERVKLAAQSPNSDTGRPERQRRKPNNPEYILNVSE